MKIHTSILLIMLFSLKTFSQILSGNVYELEKNKEKVPLPGVNVFWIGTSVSAVSDINGKFHINKKGITDFRIIVSFIGYRYDTIAVKSEDSDVEIMMQHVNKQLKEITFTEKKEDNYVSKINSRKVQVLTTGEIYKAACCNLAESFETNASVDVTYSDAITGAKQIQLLGLSGIYSQIQTENIPLIRGMASSFGLNYIPGSWMESIQISKGTSSVINGYESITGQINVEYKKPATSDKLFANIYANSNNRIESNVNIAHKFNSNLSTLLMLHGDDFKNRIDRNDDNFLDIPKTNTINIFNKWDYINPEKFISHFGIKYMEENRSGGTKDFNKDTFVLDTASINKGIEPYGFELKTKRTEAFWKNGFLFAEKPYKSLALILSAVNHDQTGFFGVNNYEGHEKTLYANLLYSSIITSTNHKFTTGLSYLLDDYREQYEQTLLEYNLPPNNLIVKNTKDTIYNWNRCESVPGVFFEYTYSYLDIFTLIAGVRADYHNTYGTFITPRMNIRYNLNETTTLRASAGLGYRTANTISENLSILASQRSIYFLENPKQEKATNYGMNMIKEFTVFKHKAQLDIDVYRTDFANQVILDMDSIPATAFIYNLKGKSFSNSYQIQLTFEPIKRFSIVVAYRINDVKITYHNKLLKKPFVNSYKGIATLSYATDLKKWQFDFTAQFNGSSRMPDQSKMPVKLRIPDDSPEYIILNVQITKKIKELYIYLGSENLTDFRQMDPVTQPTMPYYKYFDTTMVWGPVTGRIIYAGIRFAIK
ncbi:MAG: TonB-dependent receptor [Bacteroidota bacterium]